MCNKELFDKMVGAVTGCVCGDASLLTGGCLAETQAWLGGG